MKCFYCGKEITQVGDDKYRIIPLDRPYVNLYLHISSSYVEMSAILEEYLTENMDKIYDYAEISKGVKLNKKGKTK